MATASDTVEKKDALPGISWTEVSAALKSADGLKMAKYCSAKGWAVTDFRNAMVARYGAENLEFRKGKKGGVFLNKKD